VNAPTDVMLLKPDGSPSGVVLAGDAIDRTKFLGGSDAAAVMGLSPWATPVELWQQKTGRKPKEQPTKAQMRRYARGHKLEPFIRDMVIDKLLDMGLQVELLACNKRYTDPEYPWMSCEIDFELSLTGEVLIGDEYVTFLHEHVSADAKSVTGFARKKWGDENTEDVPIEYACQFMFGHMVTGRRYCLVAALRSFDDVDVFWTVRDDETIAAMRPKLVTFWVDHVLKDEPPDPYTFSDIKLLFPCDNGQAVEATKDIAEKVEQLREVKARIKDFEEAEKALTFEIGDFVSPHASLTYEGRELLTWKGQDDARIDVTALRDELPEVASRFTNHKVVRVLRLARAKRK
jgi:putative phage-type endonuclease